MAKVAIPEPKRVKIGPKTVDCIFIGYANNSSAYRFLVHKSENTEIHVNTIIESRNTAFFENVFPCKLTQEAKRTYDAAFDNDQRQIEENPEEKVEEEPRRSKRARTEKTFGPDFLTYLLEEEPRTFKEAMSTPEAPSWKEAINSKIESILQNHTWE